MTKQELIGAILEKEWKMFHTVNGEDRVDCQDDRGTFEIMRRAQYEAWDEATVTSFYGDICAAEAEGRNLSREKYIRMMESTDPAGYAAFKAELPPVSEKKAALAAELWQKYLAQTLEMRKLYPFLAVGGRPTTAEDEDSWASVETYQTSENLTYSEATLEALLAHCNALEARGVSLVSEIQLNTVRGLGYATLQEAEDAMTRQLIQISDEPCCPCCGGMDDDYGY